MVETGDPETEVDGLRDLTSWELASRMSFLLWDSMPDEALFEAAASGDLRTDAGVRTQAVRMLRDPRSRAAVRTFHRQWLDHDAIQSVNPDYMAIAAAYGCHGERVTETGQFADAYQRACDSPTGAIVEIVTSTEAISPRTTITALRAAAGK